MRAVKKDIGVNLNQPTFYWHDYETFGLNTRFDRPVQFAGLRTDMQLNAIGDADVWYCRPALDYLPSPEACIVTGITPQEAAEKGTHEAEFARRIHEAMSVRDTISIGYNNIKFDDEVTRNLLWRNLFDAYSREYSNGCSRWDLFPFTLAVWALRPEGIVWPVVQSGERGREGCVTFRLEKLTQANGLAHSHAHDAASDVEATIAFARLIAQKQPRLWNWALSHRNKNHVIESIDSGRPCVWVDASAGQAAGYLRFVMPVAISPRNKNEYIVWDCRYDPSVLDGLDAETIARRAFGSRTALQDGEERLPLYGLKVNTAPFVCSDLRIVNASVCERFQIDLEAVVANGEKLTRLQPQIMGPVVTARAPRDEEPQKSDVDGALYEGFIGGGDKYQMQRVHELSPQALFDEAAEGRIHFDDPRLQEMFRRMRARNWPELLDQSEQAWWKRHCQDVVEGIVPGVRSFTSYTEALDTQVEMLDAQFEQGVINEDLYEARQNVLNALFEWGEIVSQAAQSEDF